MEIIIEGVRSNKKETEVTLSFNKIKKSNYRHIKCKKIQNEKGHQAVIFHFTDDNIDILTNGNYSITFKENFIIEGVDKIRVFYWFDNEQSSLDENLPCFKDFLDKYGLEEQAKTGNFSCTKTDDRSVILEPKQAGNGGVLGIIDTP